MKLEVKSEPDTGETASAVTAASASASASTAVPNVTPEPRDSHADPGAGMGNHTAAPAGRNIHDASGTPGASQAQEVVKSDPLPAPCPGGSGRGLKIPSSTWVAMCAQRGDITAGPACPCPPFWELASTRKITGGIVTNCPPDGAEYHRHFYSTLTDRTPCGYAVHVMSNTKKAEWKGISSYGNLDICGGAVKPFKNL